MIESYRAPGMARRARTVTPRLRTRTSSSRRSAGLALIAAFPVLTLVLPRLFLGYKG